jgi:hypothetical protein
MRLAVLFALLLAAPAQGASRLADDARVRALASADGRAYAVVDSGDADAPFRLLRSAGGAPTPVATFGRPGAEFADIAAGWAGRVLVAFGLAVSGGEALHAGPPAAVAELAVATGPGKLVVTESGARLAFPDRVGDLGFASLETGGTWTASDDAPASRHLALDADGPYVLDQVQGRSRTRLRVVGAGAPHGPLLDLRARRHLPGSIAVDGKLVAVAYLRNGRVYLAASRGDAWTLRRIARGGPPAVAIHEGNVRVAYEREGEIMLWDGERTRQLSAPAGVDHGPSAAGPYVAWTRDWDGERTALIQRIR